MTTALVILAAVCVWLLLGFAIYLMCEDEGGFTLLWFLLLGVPQTLGKLAVLLVLAIFDRNFGSGES